MSLQADLRHERGCPSRAALAVVRSPRDYGAHQTTPEFDSW